MQISDCLLFKRYLGTIGSLVLAFNSSYQCLADQKPVLVPQKAIAAPIPTNNSSTASDSLLIPPVMQPSAESESYPLVDRMETITFGQVKAKLPLEQRLSDLEQAVFRTNYKSDSLFDRNQRLKLAIIGPDAQEQNRAKSS